jgi:hypothetical protein
MQDFSSIVFQPNRSLLRELNADKLNSILQEIRRNKPKGERGITVRQDGTGTYIGLATQAESKTIVSSAHPFEILLGSISQNPNNVLVSLRPGTINGILAGNWNSEISAPKNVTKYVVLTVTTDGQAITSSQWGLSDAPPNLDDPEKWSLATSVQILIGIVANGSVKQIIFDNLTANGKKRLTTEKNNVTLGQIPYDNWYAWQVT